MHIRDRIMLWQILIRVNKFNKCSILFLSRSAILAAIGFTMVILSERLPFVSSATCFQFLGKQLCSRFIIIITECKHIDTFGKWFKDKRLYSDK